MDMVIQAVTRMDTVIPIPITDIIVRDFMPAQASTGPAVIASITRGIAIGTTGDNLSVEFYVSCPGILPGSSLSLLGKRAPRCPRPGNSGWAQLLFFLRLILFRWRRWIRAGTGRTLMPLELAS
jgi:hypothetical protein